MDFRETLSRLNTQVVRITERLGSVAPLATRIVIGLAFFQTGTGKFRHFDNVVGFFDSLGIPMPAFNAGLVATMETVGGLMLILGLFTRFFSAGLTTAMIVALLTADRADLIAAWSGTSEIAPADVTAFTFLLFLLWLIFYGAGKLSLDALLRKLLRSEPRRLADVSSGSA